MHETEITQRVGLFINSVYNQTVETHSCMHCDFSKQVFVTDDVEDYDYSEL